MSVTLDPRETIANHATCFTVCTACGKATNLMKPSPEYLDSLCDATYAQRFAIELEERREEEKTFVSKPPHIYHPAARRRFLEDAIDREDEKLGAIRILCPYCRHGFLIFGREVFGVIGRWGLNPNDQIALAFSLLPLRTSAKSVFLLQLVRSNGYELR